VEFIDRYRGCIHDKAMDRSNKGPQYQIEIVASNNPDQGKLHRALDIILHAAMRDGDHQVEDRCGELTDQPRDDI
jgi:hypothetical protein